MARERKKAPVGRDRINLIKRIDGDKLFAKTKLEAPVLFGVSPVQVEKHIQSLKAFLRKVKKLEEDISAEENAIHSRVIKEKKFLKTLAYRYDDLKDLYNTAYKNLIKMREDVEALEKYHKKLYIENEKLMKARMDSFSEAYFDPADEKKVRESLKRKQAQLHRETVKAEKMEKELIIKQEELAQRIQDTNLAKSSYYHLSDEEIKLFEEQRSLILAGVEKYGSITLAVKKNPAITMRVASILHYAEKHQQFHEDIEIAKKVFKDSLDSEILDRALNGTMNPVFQKGEYIGDYAVKDNKLLVEVAKAKLPKEYNPRAYAQANPQGSAGTTINILSFDGVDETQRGYARNIGVVKSVDESGKVEKITQQSKDAKRMIDFYKNKKGAQILMNSLPAESDEVIIEAEVTDSGSNAS